MDSINKQTHFTPKNLVHCRDVVNYETSEEKFIKGQFNKWVAIGEGLMAILICLGLVSVLRFFMFCEF